MSLYNFQNLIGNTPIIQLPRYSPNKDIHLFAKLEGFNPGGSIKDRIALFMVKKAMDEGRIRNSTIVIEPTSGNTGIGLAMLANIYKYKFTAVLPANISQERKLLLKAYGAEIIETEPDKGTNGAIEYTKYLLRQNNKYLMLDQFSNDANVNAHYQTTGNEIITQLPGITHLVAGLGSGGTIMGAGKRLKEYTSIIRIVGVEPKEASLIQGLRNMSRYKPPIFRDDSLDEKLLLKDDDEAIELVVDLLKNEGLLVGLSSGAALWGMINIAKTIKQGVVLGIFPDRGERYLSTGQF